MTLSAYIVNRQENITRSANTWDIAARAVFFIIIVETEQGFNWAVARLAQAYILRSPHDQPSYFFLCENEPSLFFSEEYPIQAYLFFYALMGCNSFKTAANLESNMKWALNIKNRQQIGNYFIIFEFFHIFIFQFYRALT